MSGNDLISREVLLKEYEWMMTQTSDCNKPILQEHIDRIKWQPAVDAVPVTRCKDCAYYVPFEGDAAVKHCELFEEYKGEYTAHNIRPDEFCIRGETVEEMQYRMEMEQYMWESMQSMCNPEDGSL